MIRQKWVVSPEYKENYIEVLTENLLPLRMKAEITQEELANIIGISRQTYYAIETTRRQMSWNTYLSLLYFFDTNLNTHAMLRDLNAYPTDFIVTMSG
jgi:DNA-binding XRE family transcriptional regulator